MNNRAATFIDNQKGIMESTPQGLSEGSELMNQGADRKLINQEGQLASSLK